MVIAYHLIITAYGCWLPNDPRGSTSKYIASDVIAELGELHFGRKKVQPASRDIREFYRRAGEVLKYPLLTFDEAARRCIAEAIGQCIQQYRYTCCACAIIWDHTHLLIRKHKHLAERGDPAGKAYPTCTSPAAHNAISKESGVRGPNHTPCLTNCS